MTHQWDVAVALLTAPFPVFLIVLTICAVAVTAHRERKYP